MSDQAIIQHFIKRRFRNYEEDIHNQIVLVKINIPQHVMSNNIKQTFRQALPTNQCPQLN